MINIVFILQNKETYNSLFHDKIFLRCNPVGRRIFFSGDRFVPYFADALRLQKKLLNEPWFTNCIINDFWELFNQQYQ